MAQHSARDGWLALGVLVALVAGVVLLGAEGTRGTDPFEVRRSTFLTTPHGTKALFDLLREMGYDARRHRGSLAGISPEAGTLCVLSTPVPLGQDEIRGVLRWVEGGGTLVVGLGGGSLPPIARAANLGTPGAALAEALGVGVRTWPATERDHRVCGAIAGPLKVATVRFAGGRTLEGPVLGNPSFAPLVLGPFGVVAASVSRGRGRVVLFADDTPFTNRFVRSPDNAQMIILLLAHSGRKGAILFDERHQGYGEDREAVARLAGALSETGLGLVVVQAALAGAALLYLAARRFGAALPPGRARRRETAEAAAALGNAYRSARAAGLAAETLAAGARRRAAPRLGIPPTVPPEEFVERLRTSKAPGAADLARALERAAAVLDGEGGADRGLAAAARGLERALGLVCGRREERA